jgi:heme exporter protein CcmD
MDHGPFIIAAYAASALVLGWCALAPVLRGRRLRRELRAALATTRSEHAPDA